MKNRKLLLIVSIVLAMTMSLGGTLAYLTDTDADVNTMVLGNVKIVQNEQQWNADKTELVEFEQDKPLLPYVGDLGWENKDDQDGAYRRFTMKNVVDKYVTVTNMGISNAYVRTIIALEMGEYTYEEFKMIGASVNAENGAEFKFPGAWVWTDDYAAQIDGKNYNIMVAVHQDPLAPKATTIPSLLQVYLSKDADNEDVQKLDGNENGKYDILVISQAVQADGFGSAAEALEAGFGKVTEDNKEVVAGWFASIGDPDSDYQIGSPDENYPESGKNDTNNPPVFVAANADELTELLEAGATNIALAEGVDYGTMTLVPEMKNVTINAEGAEATKIVVPENAVWENVTIAGLSLENGNGNLIEIPASATVAITVNDVEFNGPGTKGGRGFSVNASSAEIIIEDCIFDGVSYPVYGNCKLTAKDTTFKNSASWVFHAYGELSQVEFIDCEFTGVGGIAKCLAGMGDGSVFTFENNALTGSCGHDNKDAKIFEINVVKATQTISGNTKDGEAWTPDSTNGLTK